VLILCVYVYVCVSVCKETLLQPWAPVVSINHQAIVATPARDNWLVQ